jgi:hypothetical protein
MPAATVNLNLKTTGVKEAKISVTDLNQGLELLKKGWNTLKVGAQAVQSLVFAYDKQFMAEQKFAVALSNSPLAKHGEELKKYASDLQNITTFGDEAILPIQGLGASIAKTVPELKALTLAALDFSKGANIDAASAMKTMIRAVDGSSDALKRHGIMLTENEKNIVKNGNEHDRLAVIIGKVNDKFGGLAVLASQTGKGAMEQFGNATGDTKEALGGLIDLPVMQFFKVVTAGVGAFNAELGKMGKDNSIKKDLVSLMIFVGDFVEGTLQLAEGAGKALGGFSKQVLETLAAVVSQFMNITFLPITKSLEVFEMIAKKIGNETMTNLFITMRETADDMANLPLNVAKGMTGAFDAIGGGAAKIRPILKKVTDAMVKMSNEVSEKSGKAAFDATAKASEESKRTADEAAKAAEEAAKRKAMADKWYAGVLKEHLNEVKDYRKGMQDKQDEADKKAQEEFLARIREQEAAQQEHLNQLKDLGDMVFNTMLDAGLNAFEGLITGQKGLREAFRDTMKSMLKGIVKWGIQTALTNSIAAVTGSASAMSAIPIIGPALGAAAAAAMMGIMAAYSSKIPKDTSTGMAQGGIVSGMVQGGAFGVDSVPARLMPGERVLNKRETQEFEREKQGRGMAQNIVINIQGGLTGKLETDKLVRESLIPALKRAQLAGAY